MSRRPVIAAGLEYLLVFSVGRGCSLAQTETWADRGAETGCSLATAGGLQKNCTDELERKGYKARSLTKMLRSNTDATGNGRQSFAAASCFAPTFIPRGLGEKNVILGGLRDTNNQSTFGASTALYQKTTTVSKSLCNAFLVEVTLRSSPRSVRSRALRRQAAWSPRISAGHWRQAQHRFEGANRYFLHCRDRPTFGSSDQVRLPSNACPKGQVTSCPTR